MSHVVIDNIDRLELTPLGRPLGWKLAFRSANAGMVHQLYVNGRLGDFTDLPEQRTFEITADDTPRELAVAAVAYDDRAVDFADELPDIVGEPGWAYRPVVVRSITHWPGDQLAVYHDNATGTVGETPAILRDIWPPSVPHWGFGLGEFGRGGFGIDGDRGPGFGAGNWGVGPFGVGGDLLDIELPLTVEGLHHIELRVRSADGEESTATEETHQAHPPPNPAAGLTATNYNPATNQLTLTIKQ
ncbi:MAG: hypothetical protein K8S55_03195 [Phycisphaerae bacterium]|nr:hypothetical protein [Phycisphaerae bacterium]